MPDPPRVGERAPDDLAAGGAAVVAFLRHVGCPFAEATMVAMRTEAERWPELEWIAVSQGTSAATDSWCEAVGGCGGVRVVADPERFAAWGLGRSGLGHFMGRRSLRSAARLARSGIRNRHPSGNRWRPAGTFAVDAEGVVRWRHLPEHAGELPDFGAAAGAAGGARG
ncbi:MAG TPA: AhpC/TSA family protein [Thermoleophilaceae bacterium]